MNNTEVVNARRARLQAWIDLHYGGVQENFRKAVSPMNQGELSGLLGAKSFGEKKARTLERKTPGMPKGYLEHPLEDQQKLIVGSPEAVISELKGDLLYTRAVLNTVLVALSRSTPAVAAALRRGLLALPGRDHGYAMQALNLVLETQEASFQKELVDLRSEAQPAAKKTAKQSSR